MKNLSRYLFLFLAVFVSLPVLAQADRKLFGEPIIVKPASQNVKKPVKPVVKPAPDTGRGLYFLPDTLKLTWKPETLDNRTLWMAIVVFHKGKNEYYAAEIVDAPTVEAAKIVFLNMIQKTPEYKGAYIKPGGLGIYRFRIDAILK